MPQSGIIPTATLRLTLPCDLHEVRGAAKRLAAFLLDQGCGQEESTDCELAFVEACNNAIQYAAPGARHLPIMIAVVCAPAEIELQVTDHTPGFDWPPQVRLPDAERERGRGLFLLRALMDETEYSRGEKANTLVLRRKRQRA